MGKKDVIVNFWHGYFCVPTCRHEFLCRWCLARHPSSAHQLYCADTSEPISCTDHSQTSIYHSSCSAWFWFHPEGNDGFSQSCCEMHVQFNNLILIMTPTGVALEESFFFTAFMMDLHISHIPNICCFGMPSAWKTSQYETNMNQIKKQQRSISKSLCTDSKRQCNKLRCSISHLSPVNHMQMSEKFSPNLIKQICASFIIFKYTLI